MIKDPRLIKPIKTLLEENHRLDKNHKISNDESGGKSLFASGSPESISSLLHSIVISPESVIISPAQPPAEISNSSLHSTISSYLTSKNAPSTLSIPKKWSLYKPMVLFNDGSFNNGWKEFLTDEFFRLILDRFPGFTHVAVNKPIIELDAMRRPFNVLPLYGDFGPEPTPQLLQKPTQKDFQEAFWCGVTQNGIAQTWAPRYTMFSRGNIKEKKRLLDNYKRLENTMVVDMYAGIGYFTLSYLSNGAVVFCWEINGWSVEGLCRGLERNGFTFVVIYENETLSSARFDQLRHSGTQAFIFLESNEFAPTRLQQLDESLQPIRHYNLGLLPLLKPSWTLVKDILRLPSQHHKKAVVHIHENVHRSEFQQIAHEGESKFDGCCVHIEPVKTFAPDVWHVVVDVEVVTA